jgi:hypothetical protein
LAEFESVEFELFGVEEVEELLVELELKELEEQLEYYLHFVEQQQQEYLELMYLY